MTRSDLVKNKTDEEIVDFLSTAPGHSHEIAAQAEMMKRLKNEIKNFNDTSTKYSEKLIDLTLILFAVAFLQLFISLRTISTSWGEWLFLTVIILYGFYLFLRRLVRSREKKGEGNEKSKN